jgi:5-methylcytosine-specific restriction endonuclease McrA
MKNKAQHRLIRKMRLFEQLGYECVCPGCIHHKGKCASVFMLEIDHIVPIRTQDKNKREYDLNHPNLDNLQLLCLLCHREKTLREL